MQYGKRVPFSELLQEQYEIQLSENSELSPESATMDPNKTCVVNNGAAEKFGIPTKKFEYGNNAEILSQVHTRDVPFLIKIGNRTYAVLEHIADDHYLYVCDPEYVNIEA